MGFRATCPECPWTSALHERKQDAIEAADAHNNIVHED